MAKRHEQLSRACSVNKICHQLFETCDGKYEGVYKSLKANFQTHQKQEEEQMEEQHILDSQSLYKYSLTQHVISP